MRLKKLMFLSLLAALVFSCNKDNTPTPIPEHDRGEQAIEDDQALIDYMSTHFYNYEEFDNPSEDFDYVIRFDTIAGDNAGKTPIIESNKLMTKTVNYGGVDQQLYILKVREGAGQKPHDTDSTYVGYRGELLTSEVFNSFMNAPIWFSLIGTQYISNGQVGYTKAAVRGFSEAVVEFGEASGHTVNPDNTITWNNDFGIGAVFMPSGLAYFSSPPSGSSIPAYAPLIFDVNMYKVKVADHDGDGIPSYMEDPDGDGDIFNDDTDGDNLYNYSDADDDGDGTPTRDEIEINEDGTINFIDTNNDGTPDYLDPDYFK